MEIEGKIWKDGRYWLIEALSLNITTQGRTRKEALSMLKDAIAELLTSYYGKAISKKLDIDVIDHGKGSIGIISSNSRLLIAFSLKRSREKAGITTREASKRLGAKSPNAYAQYERGKINMTLEKLEKIFQVLNPDWQLKIA